MKKHYLSFVMLFSLIACNSKVEYSDFNANNYSNFHTEFQNAYINNPDYTDTGYACGTASWSAPLPINLSWTCNKTGLNNKVYISENQDFSDCLIYETSNNSFDFYNAKLDTTYYWKVCSAKYESDVNEFKTGNIGPRNLYVDGVENVRDLASYGHMKQGYVYRCARLNENYGEQIKPLVTPSGVDTLLNQLKIKTEVDLRKVTTNEVGCLTDKSVLGDSVNYIQLPMAYNGNNILTFKGTFSKDEYQYDNPSKIKEFFTLLADEDNYPFIFHCSIGKDRTGCLAFLLEGLLGVSEENLYRDYMFSNFAKVNAISKMSDIEGRYVKTIKEYQGETIKDKIYNYLSSDNIGLETSTLDKIISYLSTD